MLPEQFPSIEKTMTIEDQLLYVKGVLELLKGDFRSNIFLLIVIHKEISLTKLCQITKKPKTTLFHHINRMIEANIIKKERRGKEVFYSPRLEQFKGDKGKIDENQLFKKASPEQRKNIAELLVTISKLFFLLVSNSITLAEKCIDKNLEEFKKLDIHAQGEEGAFKDFGLEMTFSINGGENYQRYLNDYSDLITKYTEIFEQEINDPIKKPDQSILVYHLGFPVKNMLEYLLKDKNA